jgi:nitroreductase/NAD-dependent dihydropyrimidine dehydrogenase PreA subunit
MLGAKEKADLAVDAGLCEKCRGCAAVCPSGVFVWRDDGDLDVHHPGRCIGCGHCVAACPTGALSHSLLDDESFTPMPDEPCPGIETVRRMLRERRSCRRFAGQPLERSEIESLIGEANHAPTSTNSQNVRFVVFQGRERVRDLSRWVCGYYTKLEKQLENPFVRLAISLAVGRKMVNAYRLRMPAIAEMFHETLAGNDRLFYGAPAVLVVFASGLGHLAAANCNLTAMEIMLAAPSLGLGTCYNGYALTALARDRKVREQVGIPRGAHAGAVLAIGRPGGRFHRIPPRKNRRIIWNRGKQQR